MKKYIVACIFVFALAFNSMSAQNANLVGAGIGYGTDIEELAIQLGAVLDFDIPVKIAPDFKYYLIGDTGPVDISMWEINANAHYYFTKSESANFYALGGLQFASISSSFDLFGVSQSTSATEIGLNIGAGANFNLGGFNLLPEVKFTLGGTEQLHLGVSAMFPI